MKVVDIPFFVQLGASLEAADELDANIALFDVLLTLYPIVNHATELLNGQHGRIVTSRHYIEDFIDTFRRFEASNFRDEHGKWRSPSEEERNEYQVGSLISKVRQLRTILVAELRTVVSFTISPSGIFDVNLLVNAAHQALDPEVVLKLEPEVLAEIDAAGKCLAFNLFTAAAFHSMRAIERVIKRYLSAFRSAEEMKKLSNWGHYINSLELIAKSDSEVKPSDEAIALIRQIKDIYRNPVIHPERVLDGAEAGIIFHSTVAAITRLASEFKVEEPTLPGLIAGSGGSPAVNALMGLSLLKKNNSSSDVAA